MKFFEKKATTKNNHIIYIIKSFSIFLWIRTQSYFRRNFLLSLFPFINFRKVSPAKKQIHNFHQNTRKKNLSKHKYFHFSCFCVKSKDHKHHHTKKLENPIWWKRKKTFHLILGIFVFPYFLKIHKIEYL